MGSSHADSSPTSESKATEPSGPGKPVAASLVALVQPLVSRPLADARVHDRPRDRAVADALGARAFTSGSHIFLGSGQRPTDRGVMAHELAHVGQGGDGIRRLPRTGADEGSAEREAERVSDAVTARSHAADLLVEDDATPGEGEQTKSAFARELRMELQAAASQELAGTPFGATECPWIDHYIGVYSSQPVASVQRMLRRWVGDVPRTGGLAALRAAVVARARTGIAEWRQTGRAPTLPPGIPPVPTSALVQAAVSNGLTRAGDAVGTQIRSVLRRTALDRLFRASDGSATRATTPRAFQASLGRGRPLDPSVRSRLEPSFGSSLSQVRVHPDSRQARRAGAHAVTVGQDIAFAPGTYRPGNLAGDALIAHEVAHTFQSTTGSASTERLEQDADMAAAGALTGIPGMAIPKARGGLRLSRCVTADPEPLPPVERSAPDELAPEYETSRAPMEERNTVSTSETSASVLIDADGDQSAELMVGFDQRLVDGLVESVDISLAFEDDATTRRSHRFHTGSMLLAPFEPRLSRHTDGLRDSIFSLGSASFTVPVPSGMTSGLVYATSLTHWAESANHSYMLPQRVGRSFNVFRAGRPGKTGPIWSLDTEVGAYGDRFRLTFVKDDPGSSSVEIGIAPLNQESTPIGGGARYSASVQGPLVVRVVDNDGAPLTLDLDGDGQADISVYDLATPEYDRSAGRVQASTARSHRFTVVATGGYQQPSWTEFGVQGGEYDLAGPGSDSNLGVVAATHAVGNETFAPEAPTTVADQIVNIEDARMRLRRVALSEDTGVVSESLRTAWSELEAAMVELVTSWASGECRPEQVGMRQRAKDATDAYGDALASASSRYTTSGYHSTSNPITGVRNQEAYRVRGARVSASHRPAHTEVLRQRLDDPDLGPAFSQFDRVALRLEDFLVRELRRVKGEDDPYAAQLEQYETISQQMHDLPDRARVVQATFQPRDNHDQQGRVRTLPVFLYYWEDDGDWVVWKVGHGSSTRRKRHTRQAGEEHPPQEAFQELNDKDLFPSGVLTYQIPSGPGGRVIMDEPWEWHEVLTWIATGLAIVGLILVGAAATILSGGAAAPAVAAVGGYVLASAGVVGAVGAGLSMADNASDGNWDTTTWVLDALTIVTGLAGGLAAAGRVTVQLGAAGSRQLTGVAARVAAYGVGARFVALSAITLGGDALTLAVFSADFMRQWNAIDRMPGVSDAERTRLKVMMLGNIALMAGLTLLSVRGDAGTIRSGGGPLMLEQVGDVTHVRIGASADFGHTRYTEHLADLNARTNGRYDGVTIETVRGSEFLEYTGDSRGSAFVQVHGDAQSGFTGRIVVWEGAHPEVITRELAHIEQLADPTLAPFLSRVTESNLASWPSMTARQRAEIMEAKVLLEIDAQRRVIAGGGDPGQVEDAFQHMEHLRGRLDRLTALGELDDGSPMPSMLSGDTPPRLMEMGATTGFELDVQRYANMDEDEFVTTYRNEHPTSRLTDPELRQRYQSLQRLHPETGALRRVETESDAEGNTRHYFPRRHQRPAPDVTSTTDDLGEVALARSANDSVSDELSDLLRQRDAARERVRTLGEQDTLTVSDEQALSRARREVVVASETIGELGADAAVQANFQGARRIYTGSGSGTFDLVYVIEGADGVNRFIVVEAKGGSSRLGVRRLEDGQVHQQGTRGYFEELMELMEQRVMDMPSGPDRDLMFEFLITDVDDLRYLLAQTPISNVQRVPGPHGTTAVPGSTVSGVSLSEFNL